MAPKQKQRKNRTIGRIAGQGGYYTDKVVPFMSKLVPKGTFASMGGTLGGALGTSTAVPGAGLVGGAAGSYLGGRISKMLGFGDYTVVSNSLMKQGMAVSEGAPIPAFGNLGHETRVTHREYIKDVIIPSSPTAFNIEANKINAGNNALFPWLAPIAASYQQYKFNGLVFEYRTLSSDITAGGALGSVILGTNYDVIDNLFTSKLAMENSQYAVSAKPSLSQFHAIECDPALTANKLYYVRDSTSGLGTSDDRFYDLGNFQLATQGLPGSAGAVLGELWVTYDVSLYKPEIATSAGTATQKITSTSTDRANIFGSNSVSTGATLAAVSGGNLTFPVPGTYAVVMTVNGNTLTTPNLSGSGAIIAVGGTNPLTAVSTLTTVWRVITNIQNQNLYFNYNSSLGVTSTATLITPVTTTFA